MEYHYLTEIPFPGEKECLHGENIASGLLMFGTTSQTLLLPDTSKVGKKSRKLPKQFVLCPKQSTNNLHALGGMMFGKFCRHGVYF